MIGVAAAAAKVARLGDVASFIRGITFTPDDVVPLGSPFSLACMRTKNVQAALDMSDVWAVPEALVKRADQRLRLGDLLVSTANSWNLVGKCCWVPDLPWQSTFGGFISALRPDPSRIEPRYLFHWFSWPRIQTTVRSFGRQTTNISNLDVERCLELQIPLPALGEQRRIASMLDKADALRAKRRAAVAQLDVVTQAMFVETFGDPVSNPRGLPVAPLTELCCRITDGTHQPPPWSETGHPFLFVSNLTGGEISFDTEKFIADETHADLTRRCPIDVGDVLYSTVGSYGVPALVRTPRKFAFQRHIAHLKPKRDRLVPEFLKTMLASQPLRRQADQAARGVAQKTVNLADIRKFLVFCPPIASQQQFAQKAGVVDRLKTNSLQSVAELEALFASLQHRAFRGEL